MMKLLFPCFALLASVLHSAASSDTDLNNKKDSLRNGLTNEERIEFIEAHHYWRSRVDPTATKMYRMYWSTEVEESAQTWTKECKWGPGFPDLSLNKYKTLGQNIHAATQLNISAVVAEWASVAKDYTFDNNSCNNSNCDPYTQVVWESSYVLGCGMTFCPDLKYHYIVCNYYHPGNKAGKKPYEKGVSCSQCYYGKDDCENNMCNIKNACTDVETRCNVTNEEYCLCDELAYLTARANLVSSGKLIFLLCFVFVSNN